MLSKAHHAAIQVGSDPTDAVLMSVAAIRAVGLNKSCAQLVQSAFAKRILQTYSGFGGCILNQYSGSESFGFPKRNPKGLE